MVNKIKGIILIEVMLLLVLLSYLTPIISEGVNSLMARSHSLKKWRKDVLVEVNKIFMSLNNTSADHLHELKLCESEIYKILYVCF